MSNSEDVVNIIVSSTVHFSPHVLCFLFLAQPSDTFSQMFNSFAQSHLALLEKFDRIQKREPTLVSNGRLPICNFLYMLFVAALYSLPITLLVSAHVQSIVLCQKLSTPVNGISKLDTLDNPVLMVLSMFICSFAHCLWFHGMRETTSFQRALEACTYGNPSDTLLDITCALNFYLRVEIFKRKVILSLFPLR